jgi:hypothetical protein
VTTSGVEDEAATGLSRELRSVGKIERVPLREVWRHEAHNLTTWLEENIDVLNDVLDFALTNVEREQTAGSFSVDLVAEDQAGGTVIIENQLERSDHDHLGKLITYAAFMDARAAVWIVAEPRQEHVRAISWLNESAPSDFYLLKIEGIRIAGSPPAPLLTLIVGPSAESREAGEAKKERAERYQTRRRFWTALLDAAKQKTRLHTGISPSDSSSVATGAGKSGLTYNYSVNQHASMVELYIAQRSEEASAEIFNALLKHKDEIEQAYGGPLEWEPLEGKRACRIARRFGAGGYRDEEKWPEIQEAMVDAMIRLEGALRPHIAQLSN